jgi:hypothetical protein
LKTTQVVTELCSALLKDPVNAPSGYHVCTDRYYISPHLADELLGMNMVTRGTVMPSRKEMILSAFHFWSKNEATEVPSRYKKLPQRKQMYCYNILNILEVSTIVTIILPLTNL